MRKPALDLSNIVRQPRTVISRSIARTERSSCRRNACRRRTLSERLSIRLYSLVKRSVVEIQTSKAFADDAGRPSECFTFAYRLADFRSAVTNQVVFLGCLKLSAGIDFTYEPFRARAGPLRRACRL